MKITGTSSYMEVEFEGKIVRIHGERLVNGFLAYVNTIEFWEPPYQNIQIDEKTKKRLIEAIKNRDNPNNFNIEFD